MCGVVAILILRFLLYLQGRNIEPPKYLSLYGNIIQEQFPFVNSLWQVIRETL